MTKAALLALTTDKVYATDKTFTETIYETFTYRGTTNYEGGKRIRFNAGQTVSAAYIDSLYTTATITSVTPNTGLLQAGGQLITIVGTGFGGATGVNIDAVACTEFKKVSSTKITCKTPARTSGAKALVLIDDGGNVSGGNVTYV